MVVKCKSICMFEHEPSTTIKFLFINFSLFLLEQNPEHEFCLWCKFALFFWITRMSVRAWINTEQTQYVMRISYFGRTLQKRAAPPTGSVGVTGGFIMLTGVSSDKPASRWSAVPGFGRLCRSTAWGTKVGNTIDGVTHHRWCSWQTNSPLLFANFLLPKGSELNWSHNKTHHKACSSATPSCVRTTHITWVVRYKGAVAPLTSQKYPVAQAPSDPEVRHRGIYPQMRACLHWREHLPVRLGRSENTVTNFGAQISVNFHVKISVALELSFSRHFGTNVIFAFSVRHGQAIRPVCTLGLFILQINFWMSVCPNKHWAETWTYWIYNAKLGKKSGCHLDVISKCTAVACPIILPQQVAINCQSAHYSTPNISEEFHSEFQFQEKTLTNETVKETATNSELAWYCGHYSPGWKSDLFCSYSWNNGFVNSKHGSENSLQRRDAPSKFASVHVPDVFGWDLCVRIIRRLFSTEILHIVVIFRATAFTAMFITLFETFLIDGRGSGHLGPAVGLKTLSIHVCVCPHFGM